MAKIGTNANCITCWSNLEPMLLAQIGSQILNYYKWNHIELAKSGTNVSGILFSWRDNSSSRVNTLGPLCLWQCFYLKLILQEWMIYFILYKGFRFLSIYSRQIAEKYGSSAMCQLEDSLVLWGVNVACFTLISVCVTYEIFGTSIPHICRPCHPWRQCKNIKRRGIFSYWMR